MHIDCNTTYIEISKTKSIIVEYYSLLNNYSKKNYLNLNNTILVKYEILLHIVSSLAKVKIVEPFHNAQITIP